MKSKQQLYINAKKLKFTFQTNFSRFQLPEVFWPKPCLVGGCIWKNINFESLKKGKNRLFEGWKEQQGCLKQKQAPSEVSCIWCRPRFILVVVNGKQNRVQWEMKPHMNVITIIYPNKIKVSRSSTRLGFCRSLRKAVENDIVKITFCASAVSEVIREVCNTRREVSCMTANAPALLLSTPSIPPG